MVVAIWELKSLGTEPIAPTMLPIAEPVGVEATRERAGPTQPTQPVATVQLGEDRVLTRAQRQRLAEQEEQDSKRPRVDPVASGESRQLCTMIIEQIVAVILWMQCMASSVEQLQGC